MTTKTDMSASPPIEGLVTVDSAGTQINGTGGCSGGATNVDVMAACATGALDHGGIVRSTATWAVVSGFLSSGEAPATC